MECGAAVLCCAGKSRLPSLTRSLHCIAPNRFHHRLPTRRFSTGNFQLHPCSFIIDHPIASPILSLPSLPLSTLKIFRPTCYLGFHCACNCIVVTRLRGCPPVVPDYLLGHVHALQTTQCHLCRLVLHCSGTIKRCVSNLLARNRYTDARMRRTNPRVSRTRRYQPFAWLLSTDRRAAAASLCLHLDISSPDVALPSAVLFPSLRLRFVLCPCASPPLAQPHLTSAQPTSSRLQQRSERFPCHSI